MNEKYYFIGIFYFLKQKVKIELLKIQINKININKNKIQIKIKKLCIIFKIKKIHFIKKI